MSKFEKLEPDKQPIKYLASLKEYENNLLQYLNIILANEDAKGTKIADKKEFHPESAAEKLIEAHQKNFLLGSSPSQQFGVFLVSLVKQLVNALWAQTCLQTFLKDNPDPASLQPTVPIHQSLEDLREAIRKGAGTTTAFESQIGQFLLSEDNHKNYAICYDFFEDLMFPYRDDPSFGFVDEYPSRIVIRLPNKDNKVEDKLNYLGIHDLGKITRVEVPLRIKVYDFKLDPDQPTTSGFKTWTISNTPTCFSLSTKSSTNMQIGPLLAKLVNPQAPGLSKTDCFYFYLDQKLEESGAVGYRKSGYRIIDPAKSKIAWPEHMSEIVLYRVDKINKTVLKPWTLFIKERLDYPYRVAVFCQGTPPGKASDSFKVEVDETLIGDGTPSKPDITKSALYASLFGKNTDLSSLNLNVGGVSQQLAFANKLLAANPQKPEEDSLVDLLNGLKVPFPDLLTVAIKAEDTAADFEETEKMLENSPTVVEIGVDSVFGILRDEYEQVFTPKYMSAKKVEEIEADELVGHYIVLLDSSDAPGRLSDRNIWETVGSAPNEILRSPTGFKIKNLQYNEIDAEGKLLSQKQPVGKEANRRVHVLKNSRV